jgi:hypothetical protein
MRFHNLATLTDTALRTGLNCISKGDCGSMPHIATARPHFITYVHGGAQ